MGLLRNASLKTRLIVLTLASSAAGLTLAFALFVIYDDHLLRVHKVEELRSAADLIATSGTAALVFDDSPQASNVLRGLESRVHIGQGVLYREDGTVLAEYRRPEFRDEIIISSNVSAERVVWKGEHLELARPIRFHGQLIGALSLESGIEDIREERRALARLVIPLFAGALVLIGVLTALLQRAVTVPIETLASLARKVTNDDVYSLRALPRGGKELRNLAQDFNHMLEAVERRDKELREAQEMLEQRVSQRTIALEQEIAERQRTEALLRESEELFRALNEASPVGFVLISNDGSVRQSNPAFRQMFGFSTEEMTGKRITDLVASAELAAESDGLREQIMQGRTIRRVTKRRKKDGSLLDVEFFSAPLLLGGQTAGQLGIFLDISKRVETEHAIRESEELFRTLSLAAPIGILRTDARGRCVYVNERFCEMTGLTTRSATGLGWTSAIHPEEREHCMRLWRAGVDMEVELADESRVLLPDGNVNWIHWRSRPLLGPDGKLRGFIAVVEDVTKRRAAEQRIIEARRAAEAANEAKGQFLANVSHEIRTPMNGILGMTEVVLDTGLTPQQREQLNLVKGCAESLMDIIDDILDFSKIESGKLQLESVPFSMLEIIDGALNPIILRAQKKGLELDWNLRGELPDLLAGDPTRLRQVLINLLGNAVKFTHRGRVSLVLDCAPDREGRTQIDFQVRDTGIGISAGHIDKIFESFQQSDSSVTREFGGTGLGLSISQKLVRGMGGEISVDTEAGKGSCFHFKLRFNRPDGDAANPPRQFARLPRARILVAVPDDDRRALVCWLLRRWGLEPHEVLGVEALLRLRQSAPGRNFQVAIVDEAFGKTDSERLHDDWTSQLPHGCRLLLSRANERSSHKRAAPGRAFAELQWPLLCRTLHENLRAALGSPDHRGGTRPALNGKARERKLAILLVEDNLVNQKLALHVLGAMGHDVVLADNGVKACEAARHQDFDLILMDLQMPVMGGLEATQLIREHEKKFGRHTPIVAMTAHAAARDERRCLEAGMDGYLTKPVKRDELRGEIERVTSELPKVFGNDNKTPDQPASSDDWDIPELMGRLEDDQEFFRELLTIFRQDSRDNLEKARTELAKPDLPALSRTAHTLKGMLRNLSMQRAAESARLLETAAHEGKAQECAGLLQDLQRGVEALLPEVEAQLAEVKS